MEKPDTNGTNGREPRLRAEAGGRVEDFGMRNARSNSCRVVETFRAFTRRRPIPLANTGLDDCHHFQDGRKDVEVD